MHYPEFAAINNESKRFEENLGIEMQTVRPPTKNQVNAEIMRLEKKISGNLLDSDKDRAVQQAR